MEPTICKKFLILKPLMAKQKIILRVDMTCDKCRKKATKITAVTKGVTQFAIEGDDCVVVVGEEIDSATLVTSLRKKVKYTYIISIEEVKPEDGKKKEEEGKKKKADEQEKKMKEEEEALINKMILWGHPPLCYSYNYPAPNHDVVVYGNSIFPNTWFTW